MDAYLAKPIRMKELVAVLDHLGRVPAEAPAPPTSVPAVVAAFDPGDVLARVEGDRNLLAELVDIFRAECPRLLANLRKRLEDGDATGVQEAAHAIKGTVGNFGGRAASEAAYVLEAMGQGGVLTDAEAGVARLEQELDELQRNLARMGCAVPA
jgi:two-component system, sensor histidine kinase and response regulator